MDDPAIQPALARGADRAERSRSRRRPKGERGDPRLIEWGLLEGSALLVYCTLRNRRAKEMA